MSYILDALRKAEAERQRGGVPGLHDQTAAAGAALADRTPGRGSRVGLVTGLVLLALVVTLGLVLGRGLWWAPSPPSADRQAGAGSPAAQAPVRPSPAPPVTTAADVTPSAAPSPAPKPASQTPPPLAAPKAMPPPSASKAAPAGAPPGVPAAMPTLPTPPAPAPAPLPRLADLPEAQRRELPPLVVGGAVQSPDPASRMLIVDGQVLREGDAPAPGLVLERIGLRSAVFSLRGLRFELPL